MIGKNISIAGAGSTGCEMALKFSQADKTVSIIDLLPREKLGLSASPINRQLRHPGRSLERNYQRF